MFTKASRSLGAVAVVGALALAGCSSTADETPAPSSSAAPTADSGLQTVTPGKLTIATGEPAYEPWVVGDAPESGEGFEAAIAYAVAEELGFAAEDVVWVRTTFDAAIAPGPKDWDFNIQQFSITEERAEFVDFSSPYYVTSQAILTTEGSAFADADSLEDLAGATIGVMAGTTSYTQAAAVFGESALQVFNNNDDVVLALSSDQVDAIVTDLPSAFFISAVQLDAGVIIGQLEGTGEGDAFGLVLPKGSLLTAAVTAAVDALREAGKLAEIEQQWLSDAVDVPVLK